MGLLRISVCLAGMLALSACGGGGGSGGGGGGSQGSLTLSPTALTFSTHNPSQTPASQVVQATINTTATGTIYLRVVVTGPAVSTVSDIQITGSTTGQGTVVPAPAAALGPGNHSSTITVTACTSGPDCSSGIIGSPQSISVSYSVGGVASAKSSLAYTLGLNPAAADYSQSVGVTASPGYTATSSVSWLTVTPGTGGSGTTQLSVNLVKSAVDAFESGDHTGTVTLASPSGNTLNLPVTLTVTKPQLEHVTPYVAVSNTSGTVILRGRYLNLLPPNSIDLSLTSGGAGIAPLNQTMVSPTELRMTHPALAAGSYSVRMHDAQGTIIDRSTARLVVVDPINYASTTLAYPGEARFWNPQSLVYDAERNALLIAMFHGSESAAANDLMRFEYTSGWSSTTVVPFPHLDRLALSANGRDLIAASSPNAGSYEQAKMTVLEPTTLVERASLQTEYFASYFSGLAVLSNNDVLALEDSYTTTGPGRPLHRYSVKKNSIERMTFPPNDFSSGFIDGALVASGDGQRVVVGSNGGSSSANWIYEYSASSPTNLMTRTSLSFTVNALRMDRTGDTVLMRGRDFFGGVDDFLRIYTRDWTMRGSLPLSSLDYVLAPDGSRAYTYDNDGRAHIYDLTATPVAGLFPEVGVLTLAGSPESESIVRMAITPDSRTLFIAGDDQVVVVALP